MTTLTILDVSHGSCAVFRDDVGVVLVDAAPGVTLLEYLREENITSVDLVMISHADDDHLGGIVGLLASSQVAVGAIYLNPDGRRTGRSWRAFRVAVAEGIQAGSLVVHTALTSAVGPFNRGATTYEILAPDPPMALSGVGGETIDGEPISANTLSAVVRVQENEVPEVLLTGDLDAVGLRQIESRGIDLRARLLVFPHHGGATGGNDRAFASFLASRVQPELAAFSIGRSRYSNPRPQVVAGLREAAPTAHIACTQLSVTCAAVVPPGPFLHLSSAPASGKALNTCCAGSMVTTLGQTHPPTSPGPAQHSRFIDEQVPTPLCRRPLAPVPSAALSVGT